MIRAQHIARGFMSLLIAAGLTAAAKTPDDWEAIQRESRILEDVVAAALRNAPNNGLHVVRSKARYLANQGVVLDLSVSRARSGYSRHAMKIDTRLESLNEIPAMVHDILAGLQIPIAPYEPEELQELQELRAEQRSLTTDSRKHRAKLRELRRKLAREAEADKRNDLSEEIASLEQELALTEQEYQDLDLDIKAQYEKLKDANRQRQADPEATDDTNVYQAVAQAMCDYGPSMKSLPDDQYLSVSLNQRWTSRYFVFEMDDLRKCRDGSMDVEKLLDRAYVYDHD